MNAITAALWTCGSVLWFASDEPALGAMCLALAALYLCIHSAETREGE